MFILYIRTFQSPGRGNTLSRERQHTGRWFILEWYGSFFTGNPRGKPEGSSHPPSATNLASEQAARLDVARLDQVVHSLYQAGLAQSTQKTYAAGKKRYIDFCEKTAAAPLPAIEKQLCRFVAYLKEEGLRHQTVKSYLAAVRHMQISNGRGIQKLGLCHSWN